MNNTEFEALQSFFTHQQEVFQQQMQQMQQSFLMQQQQFQQMMQQQQVQFSQLLDSFKKSLGATAPEPIAPEVTPAASETEPVDNVINLQQESNFETLVLREKEVLETLRSLSEKYNNTVNSVDKLNIINEIKNTRKKYSSIKGQITRQKLTELSKKKGTIDTHQHSLEISSEIIKEIKRQLKDYNTIPPEVEPIAPETEPIAPEVDPIAPEVEPIAPEVEPIAPEVDPIAPEVEPIAPETEPIAPEVDPIAPEVEPIAPEVDPIAPEVEPITNPTTHGPIDPMHTTNDINFSGRYERVRRDIDILNQRNALAQEISQMKTLYGTANNEEYQARVSALRDFDKKILGRKTAKKIYKEAQNKAITLNGGTFIELPKELLNKMELTTRAR